MVQRVLVVAPHPDDETIGCGGAILKHRQAADEVKIVFLTSGERGLSGLSTEAIWAIREREARNAARVLGVEDLWFLRLPDRGLAQKAERAVARLQETGRGWEPGLIYVPHPGESHPDHTAALTIVLRAWCNPVPKLRLYEVWTPLPDPIITENVSEWMPSKMRALRCYPSQLERVRYDHAIRGLNRYRGIMAGGCRYAEAFATPAQGAGFVPVP